MKNRPKKNIRVEYEDEGVNLSPHRQKKLNYLRTRRKLRRLQITLVRFRAFARIIAIFLLCFGLIKLVDLPEWYLNANIFNHYPNNYLEIDGNRIVSTNQVLVKLRETKLPDKPIYLLDTRLIENAVLKLSPVQKVYIRRFWFPARLKIIINEKIPVLSISPSPEVAPIALFTEDKSIIGKEFLPISNSKDLYSVITYDNFYKWSPKHIDYVIYLSKLLESASGQKLKYLDIRNPDDVFVQLDQVKLRIGELNRTVFDRSKRVGSVLSEALKIREDIDYIDLRWDNSVSIKLKDKEKAKPVEQKKESE